VGLTGATAVATVGRVNGAFGYSMAAQIAAGMLAITGAAIGAHRVQGRLRLAWSLMCVAMISVTIGLIIDTWRYIVFHGLLGPTTPSMIGLVISAPFDLTAVMLMVSAFLRFGRLRTILDSLMTVIGVASIGWVLGLGSLFEHSLETPIPKMISLATPLADLLFVSPVLFLTLTVPRRHRESLGIFTFALASTFVPDIVAASHFFQRTPYVGGYPSEVGWVMALVFIAFAGLRIVPVAAADRDARRLSTTTVALPYVAVALSCLAIGFQQVERGSVDSLLIVALVTLACLMAARQVFERRDNQSLADALREASVRQVEDRFAALIQNSAEVIAVVDAQASVQYLTPAAREVMNVKPETVVGNPFSDLVHPEDAKDIRQRLLGIAHGDAASRIEFRVRGRSGAWHWLEATPTNLLNDQIVGGIVINTRDVSDRHELEAKLRRDALHDALTDLANRVLLMDRITHALDVSQRHPGHVGLLFIDLDDFKDVNDAAGHVAGDMVLTVVADRLRKTVRASDTVARFGGDEFAVLIDECESLRGPELLASKICDAVAEPIVAAGSIYQVRASIGVALSRDGDVGKDLVTRADQAMYQAKKRGKGGVAVSGNAGYEASG